MEPRVSFITLGVGDLERATRFFGRGTLVKASHHTDWGGYAGYFSDPDGFLWEVAWNPKFPHV